MNPSHIAKKELETTTATTNLPNRSAIQHVLSVPTILSSVLRFILADGDGVWWSHPVKDSLDSHPNAPLNDKYCYCEDCTSYSSRGVLLRCALVNHFWYHETIPILWKYQYESQVYHHKTLTSHILRLTPHRRQFYANFIEAATEYPESRVQDHVFEGVRFPRLKMLRMRLRYDHVPRMDGSKIETLELDPDCDGGNPPGGHPHGDPDVFHVTQEKMERILEQIVEVFPNGRRITFTNHALAYPGTLEDFAKKMKKLEVFEHDMVQECWEDN